MRLFVAESYVTLRIGMSRVEPPFDHQKDMYVLTSDPNAAMKICSMLPRGKTTVLVGDWTRGEHWRRLHYELEMRLMRSGDKLEDCHRIDP